MRRSPHRSVPVLALVLAACAGPGDADEPVPPTTPAEAEAAAATITAADMDARIGLLAADSMRGRDTPSPELDEVADWIAAEFARMGLEPGAGDGYLQRYPVRTVALDTEASAVTLGETPLAWGGQVSLAGGLPEEGDHVGPVLVLTGEGDLDDELLARVEGRHVLVVPAESGGGRGGMARARALSEAGALAVWTLDERSDEDWATYVRRAMRTRTVMGASPGSGNPFLAVRRTAVEEVLGDAGVDLAAGGAPALAETGLTARVATTVEIQEEAMAPNVVGILPGSDPTLRDEYVLYSAHMDHVGVGSPDATGDSIFNGADDDASGTATVIEVAEALASLPRAPRRSSVFLLVSGEEKGLWGSGWYADNPTVPLEQVVANLNADMVGRNWPDTIVAIGKEHSDLGATLERVNAAHPEIGMTAIDDIWPEQNFYRRSDHFNFARKGVPILFFFNGTHEDYHRPSDEPEAIDAEKTARIGKLLFYLGLEVADADARPQWDPQSRADIVEEGG